ncbi:MAG TPA: KR domain-containing protein, partial [Phycisphaerae bacterium]|nr:KR domain-containing protein [Phycisphaerae bacterium]
MKRVSGRGAMALAELTMDEAHAAVAGYEGRVSVAVSNSVRSTVLSGDTQAIDEILVRLEAREVFCRRVKVDVASHSPQMDPIRAELVLTLSGLAAVDTRIPMVSTVTGGFVRGRELDADYWGRNVREPVLFASAVDLLVRDGCQVFLELSPHPILGTSIQQQLGGTGQTGSAWPSLKREEDERFALLETLGGLYSIGCEPDWRRIYPGKQAVASLPPYPWQRERHWYDGPPGDASRSGEATNRFGLGRRLDLAGTDERWVWEAAFQRLSHGVHWEHRVGGVATLSAASSLRIVLDAASERFGAMSEPALEDVEFLGPIVLPDEGDSQELQVVLETEDDRTASFGLHDRSGGTWNVRIRGRVSVGVSGSGPMGDGRVGIDGLREYAPRFVPGADEYESLGRAGIAIGDSARVVDGVCRERGGAIARLRFPEAADRLTALLDGVFHLSGIAARGSGSPEDGDLFVPVRVDLIRLSEGASPETWARAERRDAEGPDSEVVEDVVVLDPDGQCLADVRGVRLIAVAARSAAAMPVEDLLYEVAWQRQEGGGADEAATRRKSRTEDGVWLLFADRLSVANILAEAIARDGGSPVLIERGDAWCAGNGRSVAVRPEESEDITRLLQMFVPGDGSTCRGLVYLWGLDGMPSSPDDRDGSDQAQNEACEPLLLLLRHAALAGWARPPKLWLVTGGAQRVVENEPLPAIWHAALWGLGRVAAAEHPEIWGGTVDVEASSPERAAEAVWHEVRSGAPEDQVVYRGESRFVARLERRRPSGTAHPPRLRADATYLVTGGLGALGSQVAQWMVTRGARRFLFLGRTVLPPRGCWSEPFAASIGDRVRRVRDIEALGASVHVASIDIAEEGAVRACLEQFAREGWPPVRGVVHAAGVIQDRLLRDLDVASWKQVFRAKGLGAWRLHEAFLGEPLDFFVLFSSLGSLLGQEGQGSYAGANAFLDALAHHRRALGRTALSLSWGPWSSLGFSKTAGGVQVIGQLSRKGIGELSSAQALEAMSRAMGDGATHVLV